MVVAMAPFSPFDKRLLTEGLAYFDRPRLAALLESLGPSKQERVDVLVTMLRHCSPEEFAEAVAIFERATARAARDRDRGDDPDDRTTGAERRTSRSAERRAQRRRSA